MNPVAPYKLVLALAWGLGWIHVIWFTPEGGESVTDTIAYVLQPDISPYDPLVFVVFNLLGVWPLVLVAVLVQDNQGKLRAWPFVFSSMILGNSALYIYLFLRWQQGPFTGSKSMLVRFAESRLLALALLASTVALLVYGAMHGNFAAFMDTWRANYFVNVMTVDLFLFPLAFACVLADDMRRRDMPINGLFWLAALTPPLGAVVYLCVRKPLPETKLAAP